MHAVLDKPVINLVDVRKIINGIAVLIFVINADFVIQNRMKPNILEAVIFFTSAGPADSFRANSGWLGPNRTYAPKSEGTDDSQQRDPH